MSASLATLDTTMANPRHSNRFTKAQKDALLKAVLIDGLNPTQAWRAATAGTLGMPAFEPGRRYVYQLIKRNREAFELEHPEALAKSTTAALILAHTANLKALRGLATETDPTERARVAKAVADTQRALGSSFKPAHAVSNTTKPDTPSEDSTASVVTDLLSRAKQGERSGSLTLASNGSAPGS